MKILIWLQNLMTPKDEILLMTYLAQIKVETCNFRGHATSKIASNLIISDCASDPRY